MRTENQKRLLELLWQFHSILKTAWPRPGVPEMANASVFIGTNLFKTLGNGLREIEEVIRSETNSGQWLDFVPFLKAFNRFFFQIGLQDRNRPSVKIDRALNLLYLASGIFYLHVAEVFSESPEEDMEKLAELLNLCQWHTNLETTNQIFSSLMDEMLATERDFPNNS